MYATKQLIDEHEGILLMEDFRTSLIIMLRDI
jgi:hypothetical protein